MEGGQLGSGFAFPRGGAIVYFYGYGLGGQFRANDFFPFRDDAAQSDVFPAECLAGYACYGFGQRAHGLMSRDSGISVILHEKRKTECRL